MAGKYDIGLISRIQQANDIVDVISEHLSLTKKGKELVGLCPFHTDHRPSMYVNPAKQIFKCFACSAGGDVVKFVQMKEGLTFVQSLERLANRAGIRLEKEKRAASSPEDLDVARLAKFNDWAANLWAANLWDEAKGAVARKYLEQRKISIESAKTWRLGFAMDSWDDFCQKARAANIGPRMLIGAGFAVEKENGCYDKFRNRLMFPIVDATGRVIGFGGRTLGDDPAKYMNSPATALFDKSHSLYGLDKARQTISEEGTAVVVEGYTDVMMSHQHGVANVVAALGTSFTAGHARILKRYGRRVILVFDSDVAGMAAAQRAVEVCLTEKLDLRLAFVPEGKDPCDYLLQAGAEAFRQVLSKSVDVVDYAWKSMTAGLSPDAPVSEKAQIIDRFLGLIASAITAGHIDGMSRAVLTGKLSELVGISLGKVERELDKLVRIKQSGQKTETSTSAQASNPGDLLYQAQSEVLEALLREPALYGRIEDRIVADSFGADLKPIAEAVFSLLQAGGQMTLSGLLGQIEEPQSAQKLLELEQRSADKDNAAVILDKAMDVIENQILEDRRRQVRQLLRDDDTESLRQVQDMLKLRKSNLRSPGVS